jgi:putative DNA primase/helicase
VSSNQVRADADDAGYSWRTIQRAKKALGIEAVKEGMRGGWVWKLPSLGCEERHGNPKSATQNNVAAFNNLGTLQENAPAENDEIEAVL